MFQKKKSHNTTRNSTNKKDDGFESFVAFDSLLNTLDGAPTRKRKKNTIIMHSKRTSQQMKQSINKLMKREGLSSQRSSKDVEIISQPPPKRSKVSQYLNKMKGTKESKHGEIKTQPSSNATSTMFHQFIPNNNAKKESMGHLMQKKDSIETNGSINNPNPTTHQSAPMTTIDCNSQHPLCKKITFQHDDHLLSNNVPSKESSAADCIQIPDDNLNRQTQTLQVQDNVHMTKPNHSHLCNKDKSCPSSSWISKLHSQSIFSRQNRLGYIGKYACTATNGQSRKNLHSLDLDSTSISHFYTPSDTIRLDLGLSPLSSSSSLVTCMEFDHDGTYLAVGDSLGYIRIYDFEEIHAADMSNSSSRQSHTSKNNSSSSSIKRRKIIPCVKFHTGNHRIASITWCPPSLGHQDLLAVSFSNYKEVRIYDLSITSASGPHFIPLNDPSNVRGSGHSLLTFLNGIAVKSTGKKNHPRHLLAGGSDGTVRLWSLPNNGEGKGKLLWSCNPWNSYECGTISDVIHLPSFHPTQKKGLVLIATSMGHFAIVNLDQLVHKSFSISVTPEVISAWSLSQMKELRNTGLPKGSKWVGVKRCFPMTQLVSHKRLSLDLLIVTNAGWVLSMKTNIEKQKSYVVPSRPMCQVLHQTPKMETYSSTGEYYGQDQSTSCVPSFDSIACYQDSHAPTLIITGIKADRKYLASSDRRVLDSSASSPIVREANELLMLNARSLPTFNDETVVSSASTAATIDNGIKKNYSHSIRLAHGSPTHIAIHPGNGFMVVVTTRGQGVGGLSQSSMELLSLRKSRRPLVNRTPKLVRNNNT